MKKGIFIGLTVLSVVAMSSCKKQYTCICTGSNEFVDYEGTVLIEAKPNDAASVCSAQSGLAQGGVQTTCIVQE